MMERIRNSIFAALLSFSLYAQEIHFSQFNENPALLNPALTGVANPLRASVAYREQWRSLTLPYKTYGVSFETRLNNSNWKQVDKFRDMTFKERGAGLLALGISVYNDKVGAGLLSQTNTNFNMATFIPVTKKSLLSLGIQAGLVQRRIENAGLVFPDQYTGTGYESNMGTAERFNNLNYVYPDLATGCLWSYGQEQKRIAGHSQIKATLGFSAYHLLQPRQQFLLPSTRLSRRFVFHGDLFYEPPGSDFAIVPSCQVQWLGASYQTVGGFTFKYFVKDNSHYTGIVKRNSLGLGLYGRSNDAVITAITLELKEQYVIGFSYDINASSLSASSKGKGAFELTLRYTPAVPYLYEKK